MSESCQAALRCSADDLRQAMSIHTKKITDACRDKDCIEDLRVYLTTASQNLLDCAAGARVRCADLLYAYVDVEPVAFDRHHYCVDVTFYYRILADAIIGGARPAALTGLAVFSKRVVLCGEDSHAHIFRSDTVMNAPDGITRQFANRPTAVVEVLDPMVLSSKVKELCHPHPACEETAYQIPECIRAIFDDDYVFTGDRRRLYVTLGQFSIIRLERDAQIVVPFLQYAIPDKVCCDAPGCGEDPCEAFSQIPFPCQKFTPTGCDAHCDCHS